MISSKENESEIIELEVYRLSMYSIENYARKFKADGVEQSDMIDLYNRVKKAVSGVATTSDNRNTEKDVMGRFSSIEGAIENAYRE